MSTLGGELGSDLDLGVGGVRCTELRGSCEACVTKANSGGRSGLGMRDEDGWSDSDGL